MNPHFFLSVLLLTLTSHLLNAQVNAWEIEWEYGGVIYDGLLWQGKDGNGYMRVRYFHNGGVNIVEQRMKLYRERFPEGDGFYLLGYSPYYIKSATGWESYSADNLLILTDGYTTKIFNVDDAWRVSEVTYAIRIETLDQYYRIKQQKYGGR